MKKFWKKFKNDETGTTAIEFAFVGTIFLVLVLSVIEMGRYFFTWNSLQYAIEQAARYALVNEDVATSVVEDFVVSQMPSFLVDPDSLTIQINYTNSSDVDFIELSGTYDYNIFSPVLPGGLFIDSDMRVSARMPVL